MSENIFDPTWLNTRFPFDEAGRNKTIDEVVMKYLGQERSADQQPLTLLDVGAGTAANFLHFFEKINHAQEWFFLDHDIRVLQAGVERIKKYAISKSLPIREIPQGIVVERGGKTIKVKIFAGSFEKVEEVIGWPDFEIVMASAFFDLFSTGQLVDFLDKIALHKIPLLLTLNYFDMRFFPTNTFDTKITQWYGEHMQKPREGRSAMGAQCSSRIRSYLLSNDIAFCEGVSSWKISGKDQPMLNFLLGFIESSLFELDLEGNDRHRLDQWLQLRKQQWQHQSLAMEVDHFDFFATF